METGHETPNNSHIQNPVEASTEPTDQKDELERMIKEESLDPLPERSSESRFLQSILCESVRGKPQNLGINIEHPPMPQEIDLLQLYCSESPNELQRKLEFKGNGHGEESSQVTNTPKKDRNSPLSSLNEEITQEREKKIEFLFQSAKSCASKGEIKTAISNYKKIVILNDKITEAWIELGHCYIIIGDNYGASHCYQKAINVSPVGSQKDYQLLYGLGLLFQKNSNWKRAEDAFKTALALNPTHPVKGEILYRLGITMKTNGNLKEAAKILMNSILIGPFPINKTVAILSIVGKIQEKIGEIQEAVKSFKQAITLDETCLEALLCVGWLSFQSNKTNEALEYLTRASLLDESNVNIAYMCGRCYLNIKRYSKAYDCFHKSLTSDAKNSMYWCSLGILFAEMNQIESAHECFVNALNFDKKNPENYFNMGCLYELCSQFQDAIAMYEKTIEISPRFQLAYIRKRGAIEHMENKEKKLEVQFMHHILVVEINPNLKIDKPVFSFLRNQINRMSPEAKRNSSVIINQSSHENEKISFKNPIQTQTPPLITQPQNKPKSQPKPINVQQTPSRSTDISTLQALMTPKNLSALEALLRGISPQSLRNLPPQNQKESNNNVPVSSPRVTSEIIGIIASLIKEALPNLRKNQQSPSNEFNMDSIPLLNEHSTNPNTSPERDEEQKLSELDKHTVLTQPQKQFSIMNEIFTISRNVPPPQLSKNNSQGTKPKEAEGLNSEIKSQTKSPFKLTHKLQGIEEEDPAPEKKVKVDNAK